MKLYKGCRVTKAKETGCRRGRVKEEKNTTENGQGKESDK